MKDLETKYLERLSELYPTIAAASTEIINLQAILNLPKGTEHFLTDVHGEYEAFAHVLKNGSGSVRRKIEDVFGNTMSKRDKKALATLIYYPKQKMDMIKKTEPNMEDWYRVHLYLLIEVSKRAASKYTRSKVRKSLPKDFAYVIEELITEKAEVNDKELYYNEIISTIIRIGRAEEFIEAISELIQRLVVDHMHIVGDIYDRGPGPHIIMDKLMTYHSLDIQWGNHDVLWMGAAAGQRGCIANAIRICARYGNLDILEEGYGINLLPLATFALRVYGDDPCECFKLKAAGGTDKDEQEMNLRIHKAISVIQFNCEKLQQHMRFLLAKGGLYKVYNDNLLYHGCVPLNEDGSLKEVEVFGKMYKGRELYDTLDSYVRKGFFALDEKDKEDGRDIMWYIWLHPDSPLFGKNKMATFERYFLAEKETHLEKKNPYYSYIENEKVIDSIMEEFGLDPGYGHIVNGHVPVKRKDGESPVKCGGKVMVIDGGFSKAYQKETGIAGYTLVFNSYGLLLVAHEPFESTEAAIENEIDIHSEIMVVKRLKDRLAVGDTDVGRDLREQISDLERLLAAYRNGEIIEKL